MPKVVPKMVLGSKKTGASKKTQMVVYPHLKHVLDHHKYTAEERPAKLSEKMMNLLIETGEFNAFLDPLDYKYKKGETGPDPKAIAPNLVEDLMIALDLEGIDWRNPLHDVYARRGARKLNFHYSFDKPIEEVLDELSYTVEFLRNRFRSNDCVRIDYVRLANRAFDAYTKGDISKAIHLVEKYVNIDDEMDPDSYRCDPRDDKEGRDIGCLLAFALSDDKKVYLD